MTRRRIAAAAVVVAALTGCGVDKPAPGVTMFSGSHSARAEAAIYCFDGAENCHKDASAEVQRLEVVPGDTVGISVDSEIADKGWILTAGQNRTRRIDEHYFKFTPGAGDFDQSGVFNLQVQSLSGSGDDAQVTGAWSFLLVRAD